MGDTTTEAFIAAVARLVGMPCWSVQVSGIGSLANLHFGEKVRRDQIMSHPDFQIDVDERVYQGQVTLYLEECPWRLDSPDEVLCSWMDSSEPGGRLFQELSSLKDHTVTAAEVTLPAFDLTIQFDSGQTLRIFPDQANPDEGDNYSLVETLEQRTFVLAAHSTLYIE